MQLRFYEEHLMTMVANALLELLYRCKSKEHTKVILSKEGKVSGWNLI